MRKLVETVLKDQSTREVFLFRIECASCGAECGNKPLRFTKAGVVADSPGKQVIYDALYEQELRLAREFSVQEAAEHMNYCPICRRLVCNGCFMICEDLDMCCDCAERLDQTGQRVLHVIVDAAG